MSGDLFSLAHGFGEFLGEHIFLVLFGVDGLTEDALAAVVLVTHVARGGFEVFKGALAGRGRVGDDGSGGDVDFEGGAAFGAGDFEGFGLFWAHNANLTAGWRTSRHSNPIWKQGIGCQSKFAGFVDQHHGWAT